MGRPKNESEESASNAMAAVVTLIGPSLKAAGFKQRRHTFNRSPESGLVQVVNFQMGQFPIGAYEIPGLRPNLYGKFTVNVGVFVREVFETTQELPAPKFVNEYDCEFRARLSELFTPPRDDTWWSLDNDRAELASMLAESLRRCAEPWFARYASRATILDIPREATEPPGWPVRAPVALAIMRLHLGERDAALSILREYLAAVRRQPRNPKHGEWVLDLAKRLGFRSDDLGE